MKTSTLFLSAALLLGAGLSVQASQQEKKAAKTDAAVIAEQLPSYPLTTCPKSKQPLGEMGDPIDVVTEGRLVRVCCGGCVKDIKKDPTAAIAAIDAAVVKAQTASYPLDTCVISGEKLTAMGDPIDLVHGTRLVRLCCNGCLKSFAKNPDQHIAKINEALVAQQKKTYPIDQCLVSSESLGDAPIDYLYGTRLVRFCCKGCVKAFNKNPKDTLAKLDAAAKKKG
jgi:hypothetical protein